MWTLLDLMRAWGTPMIRAAMAVMNRVQMVPGDLLSLMFYDFYLMPATECCGQMVRIFQKTKGAIFQNSAIGQRPTRVEHKFEGLWV